MWFLGAADLAPVPGAHPGIPQREGELGLFMFLHDWLINAKKSCPLSINSAFHQEDLLVKLNIYNSKAGVSLLGSSDG